MEQKVIVNGVEYELIDNKDDAFYEEEFIEKYTDYFCDYDYVVGDYAYNKLRLKGFNDGDNPKVNKVNNIKGLDYYLKNHCAYGCKYFVLKKQ
ncbi:MAG: YutD-like domain-containing protein [Bacilli bacterium]|jgi:uncharacterized protein YutD|nr:DUF1027 domain-containing protein [Bacilli bacterium]